MSFNIRNGSPLDIGTHLLLSFLELELLAHVIWQGNCGPVATHIVSHVSDHDHAIKSGLIISSILYIINHYLRYPEL